jgi:hypothetical protein
MKKREYLSLKKSPKSSTTTDRGNVSCRWNAAKYFLIPSSSSTYLKKKGIDQLLQL